MIKITKKALYTLVALFLLNSCYMDYVYGIRVINYTDKNYVTYDSYYDSLGAYCDSLNSKFYKGYDENKINIIGLNGHYINRKDNGRFSYPAKSIEGVFSYSPDGKIRFYFITDSVFFNNPWDTIVKYQMYDKKLTYTAKELKLSDGIIEVR